MKKALDTPETSWPILGKALAGHFLLDAGTDIINLPQRYQNPLTDWVALVIAEAHARHALDTLTTQEHPNDPRSDAY